MQRLVSGVRKMNWWVVRRKNSDTAQYLVCPSFPAKTVRQGRLMLQISFLMTCNGILTHSASKALSRARMLLTSWRSLTRRPKWSHKCPMGVKSGDLAGYCNTLTLWMRKMLWVCLAVCRRALSCWKIQTLCCCKYGTTTRSIIPSRLRNANVGTARFQSSGV